MTIGRSAAIAALAAAILAGCDGMEKALEPKGEAVAVVSVHYPAAYADTDGASAYGTPTAAWYSIDGEGPDGARTHMASADGNFIIENLPPGKWTFQGHAWTGRDGTDFCVSQPVSATLENGKAEFVMLTTDTWPGTGSARISLIWPATADNGPQACSFRVWGYRKNGDGSQGETVESADSQFSPIDDDDLGIIEHGTRWSWTMPSGLYILHARAWKDKDRHVRMADRDFAIYIIDGGLTEEEVQLLTN